ncbi:MAG: hypothetical protein JXX29_19385 [Deltaproteobacteria bacterium]|nr:hypothetical protein [Deltaproteobacteria bacterium]MBN2673852.1 hypothetical protein [Deltaproteobacteria bacterium]
MTEAVMVIPFLLVVWIALNSVYSYYFLKIDAVGEAGNLALKSATIGDCSDIKIDSNDVDVESASFDQNSFSDVIVRLSGVHPLALVHVESAVSREKQLAGRTVAVTGTKILACNMRPIDGLMEQIVASVKSLIGVDE